MDVYQDEQVRQDTIQRLEREHGITADWHQANGSAMLLNVKFRVIRFVLTPIWIDDVLERKCMISATAYFEPYSCVPTEKRGISVQYGSVLCASMGYCSNMIFGDMPPGELRRAQLPANPILLEGLDMMRAKLAA